MRMADSFDEILDKCIDRINRGESLKSCLTAYPQYARQLEPLLGVIFQTKEAYFFQPSANAKRAARQRFNQVREESLRLQAEKCSLIPRIFAWPKTWIALSTIILIALIGYFWIIPALFPKEHTTQTEISSLSTPEYSQGDNFVFLISDEKNAIEDFSKLNILISKIGLHLGDGVDQWIELKPKLSIIDLTLLQEDNAQEIWRGNIPRGQYSKVFIYIDNISGILADDSGTASITLTSNRLQFSKQFNVGDSLVNFIYDVTVFQTGQSGQYTLKPQIAQSGADKTFKKITPDGEIE